MGLFVIGLDVPARLELPIPFPSLSSCSLSAASGVHHSVLLPPTSAPHRNHFSAAAVNLCTPRIRLPLFP